ncbi:PREDICTED: mediator of RNA polymerase II transcription subunit 8 isoform X2 [Populus euphratica]|uniref:Mediator of RNA polymerase II transcription subunit 8 isoform X2 n=1 Tax=Populus euphratica TaxID=75702 RepID=A0AAJ6Y8M3_POPEU|nr:PREDICTED: mediator of RNA polymerase II transcription subunit 8 isoform X2 [Populus euphratica]
MAAMEGVMQDQSQLQNQQQQQMVVPERLNHAVQQQLNLESVKTRAISLFKALTRILEDFDAYARTNTTPKWQDILGQYSMVNLELFSIVDEIKKVSKAFVVHPKNVNAENAIILPVMLSSKLLPEMEMDDNSKREHLLQGMQSLPISSQIEKLKARIDMIAAACEGAEKVLADTRKAYQFGTRQGPTTLPTLDKAQAAKILEQENLLRAAVNGGEGLRVTGDQRQMTSALPVHLVDVLAVSDGMHSFSDSSGMYMKNTPPISNSINNQGSLLQPTGTPVHGRSAASPSAATSATSFDHTTPSPLPYANSPRSGTNMMNTPSPQQQVQHQQQQQQRQKMMQLPQHQHQILAQQQLRQSSLQALGQNQMSQMHDLQSQGQQKFQPLHGQHQMQYSQPMGHQQFQSRQLSSGHVQHGMGQSQLNQGNQLNRHLSQFSSAANTSLFNTGQGAPNTQMIPNMSSTMSSQPRMQFGLAGNNPQRSLASTVLNDQMYNMGVSNPGGMMPIQQQQQLGSQGAFGNMQPNVQNLQSSMAALQNASQNHPNFAQQRQQNQQ